MDRAAHLIAAARLPHVEPWADRDLLRRWVLSCMAASKTYTGKHPPWHRSEVRELLKRCLPQTIPEYDAICFELRVGAKTQVALEMSTETLRRAVQEAPKSLEKYVEGQRLLHWKRTGAALSFGKA